MITITDLLAFGTTLVDLVRVKIPYSLNMIEKDQLFDGLTDSAFYIDKYKKLTTLKQKNAPIFLKMLSKQTAQDIQREGSEQISYNALKAKVKNILRSQVGNCGELCNIAMVLSYNVTIFDKKENIYCSTLEFKEFDHAALLLHQDYSIIAGMKFYDTREYSYSGLNELSEKIDNAVIIDPWIYQITPLKHYQRHIQAAAEYNVQNRYASKICFNDSFLLGNNSGSENSNSNSNKTTDPVLEKMVQEFNSIYEKHRVSISKRNADEFPPLKDFLTLRSELIAEIKEKEKVTS